MNAYMKGAIGFFGCAAVCTVSYQIGKHVGREEALREITYAELPVPSTAEIEKRIHVTTTESENTQEEPTPVVNDSQTTLVPVIPKKRSRFMDKLRAVREIKDAVVEGGSVIKDILRNPDGKKMTMAVENDEAVIRISENK